MPADTTTYSIRGLSSKDVEEKQKEFGLNVLPEKKPPSKAYLFLSQLKNPLVYVLLGSSIVTFAIGDISDAIIILVAVGMNTILGFVQENKTSNALTALRKFISEKSTVFRNGVRETVDTKYIVPNDIVFLSQGNKVPADGKLVSSNRFHVNEAILTGESLPVEKNIDDKVFMGTIVSSGQAVIQIQTIGSKTEMGKIAAKIQENDELTPFQIQLKKFSKQLLIVIGVIISIVFAVGLFHGISLSEIFITSVALAVSSIPEGLLVSLTIVLTIGMQKILKRKGLVRRLAAAETLGGVSVICVDKTGTLTEGKMEVSNFVGDESMLATQSILANDLDDPIVISAYKWAENQIQSSISEVNEHARLDSIPFSSKEKFFISLHKWNDKNNMIFVNGAPEMLLEWTNIAKHEKEEILSTINKLTQQGKRVLGLARKEVGLNKKHLDVSDAKEDLKWTGILAFSDPVRKGLKEEIEKTSMAGIRTVVITGDYVNTSIYILSQLGIDISNEEFITGDMLSRMTPEQLSQEIGKIKLFARTTPDQKLSIVEALKANGEVVAMVGDGVNDAPALHKSDIGIVVNEASDVSKETADLVLLDSSFSTIVHAIEEGRVMFENIRKIILYLLCDAFVSIILIMAAMMFNLPLPITVVQILWINLISDGLPSLALTMDPKRRGLMNENPRRPNENIITNWMVNLIAIVSFTSGLLATGVFYFVFKISGDLTLARSVTFLTVGINTLFYVFSVRAPSTSFIKTRIFKNKWLNLAVFAGLALQILPFASETSRKFFGISTVPLKYWTISIFVSATIFLFIETFKHFRHSKIIGVGTKQI